MKTNRVSIPEGLSTPPPGQDGTVEGIDGYDIAWVRGSFLQKDRHGNRTTIETVTASVSGPGNWGVSVEVGANALDTTMRDAAQHLLRCIHRHRAAPETDKARQAEARLARRKVERDERRARQRARDARDQRAAEAAAQAARDAAVRDVQQQRANLEAAEEGERRLYEAMERERRDRDLRAQQAHDGAMAQVMQREGSQATEGR